MLQKIEYFLYAYCVVAFSIIFISWLKDKFAKKSPPAKKTNEKLIQLQKNKDLRPVPKHQTLRFSVEANGVKNVMPLTQANFKTLLSKYFVATEYLFELWSQHPFHLTINDDLHLHYARPKDCLGFIRSGEISEIFVLTSVSQKQKTGILLHEIAHDRAFREARGKQVKIQAHGKEFKRHLNHLFAPLLVNDQHFMQHKEISKHLRYEARKYSPPLSICK